MFSGIAPSYDRDRIDRLSEMLGSDAPPVVSDGASTPEDVVRLSDDDYDPRDRRGEAEWVGSEFLRKWEGSTRVPGYSTAEWAYLGKKGREQATKHYVAMLEEK